MTNISNEELKVREYTLDLIDKLNEFKRSNKQKRIIDFCSENGITVNAFKTYLESIKNVDPSKYEQAREDLSHKEAIAYAIDQEELNRRVDELINRIINGVPCEDGTTRKVNSVDYEILFGEYNAPYNYSSFVTLLKERPNNDKEKILRSFFATISSKAEFYTNLITKVPSNVADIKKTVSKPDGTTIIPTIEDRYDVYEMMETLGFKYFKTYNELLRSYAFGELDNEYQEVIRMYQDKLKQDKTK